MPDNNNSEQQVQQIPPADLDKAVSLKGMMAHVQAVFQRFYTEIFTTGLSAKYEKPSGGIPGTDLANSVQTSLGKADTAYQKPSGGIPGTDLASSVRDTLDKVQNTLDIELLPADYVFKPGDTLVMNGVLYKCTAQTENTPFTLLAQDGKILYVSVNGQKCYMTSGTTLNAGWQKVADIDDKYYLENRVKNHFDIITDTNVAVLGNGYGVCETDATTAAKVVSIGNFILKTNGIVSVRFTKTIDVADATLNVSGTGAKTIRINGSNIQPGAVKAGNTVMFQYDGTYWNVVSIQGLEQSGGETYFWVDLGLPSGLKWAKRNILTEGTDGFAFEGSGYYCSFFSWGNTEGHAPSDDAFTYDFGNSNSGPYASTPGSKLTGNIPPSMDAARMICGAPWRMPTSAEFQELLDNCVFVQADGTTEIPASTTNKLVTVDGVVGIYLKSKKNGNTIFFPCCGRGDGTSLNNKGSVGFYGSGSLYSAADGLSLSFSSTGISPQNHGGRYTGFAIRPVF